MRKRDEMLEPYEGKPSRTVLRRESGSNPADLAGKTDSVTGKGLYGVTFLLYNSGMTPIGQYTSDNNGYVYIEDLTHRAATICGSWKMRGTSPIRR